MEKIITNKIRCKKCGDIIESTHCHDFKFCKCGAVAVDAHVHFIGQAAQALVFGRRRVVVLAIELGLAGTALLLLCFELRLRFRGGLDMHACRGLRLGLCRSDGRGVFE